MKQCMDSANLHRRLKKSSVSSRPLIKWWTRMFPVRDVLVQINAAKGALHKVGQVVFEGHLNHCVRDGIEHGDADKTIAEFAKSHRAFLPYGADAPSLLYPFSETASPNGLALFFFLTTHTPMGIIRASRSFLLERTILYAFPLPFDPLG